MRSPPTLARTTRTYAPRARSPNLRVLDASGNRLSGPLPAALGYPARLRELRLGRNALSGRLPGGLGAQLGALTELDLSGNQLDPGSGLPNWLVLDG